LVFKTEFDVGEVGNSKDLFKCLLIKTHI
jgi:hypothetical protein